jgi:hypothetical protein
VSENETAPTGARDQPGAEEPEAEEPVFANRAERRAKGKGKSTPHQHTEGKGPVGGSHGPVQARRNYGSRRTGG